MKNIFLLAALAAVFALTACNKDNDEILNVLDKITDPVFRTYCEEQMKTWDTDRNGKLSTTEAAAVYEIGFHGTNDYDGRIKSLNGIEYFTSLLRLNCGHSQLTSLDVSKNTALTQLSCFDNQLTSLDVSKNTALLLLECYKNQLTSLDVSHCTGLASLLCEDNQLTSLDISKNTNLVSFRCSGNPGDGESMFPVKAWFDSDNVPEPATPTLYFATESWTSGGKTIAPVYSAAP